MLLSWSISSICYRKTNLSFLVLCAIIKSVEGLVYLLEPCSCWELVISYLNICLNSLKWDKSLSVCVLFNSFCSLVLLCSLVELWNQLCVNLILRYNLDNLSLYYTFVCFLVYLVFCPNYIFLWFLKVLCMHFYSIYILWHASLSLIQYIG